MSESLWHQLKKQQKVKGDMPAREQDEVENIWYIRLIQGIAGWLAALFLMGFFLLWEPWQIKTIVWGFITNAVRNFVNLIMDIAVRVGASISKVETSDLIGLLLILIAMILILNRARNSIIRNHPSLSSCFKCEGDLRRTHRKMKHKLLEILLFCKVKRYSCRKCSFEGIALNNKTKPKH